MCRPRPEYFFAMDTTRRRLASVRLVLGGLIALGDALGQLDLLVGGQQLDLADLLEIHAHRIIQIVFCGQLQRVDELFLVVAVGDLVHVHAEIVGRRPAPAPG